MVTGNHSNYIINNKVINKTVTSLYRNNDINKAASKMENIFETTIETKAKPVETRAKAVEVTVAHQQQRPETLKDAIKGNFINLVV